MPSRTGKSTSDFIDLRFETYSPPTGWPEHQAWWSVDALGGNDTVHGSPHNDSINGGDGNDTIMGHDGNDSLRGSKGYDILRGGAGNDSLNGGADNDELYGEGGQDSLMGGDGNDYMDGGAGNDTLIGGYGGDSMIGGAGDDVFFGDAGKDTMRGGAGNDRLWGGSGDDVYHFNGSGIDTINEGVTNTGSARTDATYDMKDQLHVDYTAIDWTWEQRGNDLFIGERSDLSADGVFDNGVTVEDFFLGGHHFVETLHTIDGHTFDLMTVL